MYLNYIEESFSDNTFVPSLPTQRCIAELKKLNATYQVVERWNSWAKKRIDLFGCIDILAIIPCDACESMTGRKLVGIQACAGGDHAKRRAKAMAEPKLGEWLLVGNEFEIWSWAKRGERGKRKVWTLRREEITLESFINQPLTPIEIGKEQLAECTTTT